MNTVDQELIEAVKENNLPELERLLSVGADVNVKDNREDFTPLHWASMKGHLQVFQTLREHGADVEANDIWVKTPLHWACFNGHVAVVNELLSPNDINGATTGILGKYKRQGADIQAKDNNGESPLHKACFHGHFPVVKALLSRGANILAANNFGLLPIHFAVGRGYSAVSKYLLREFYSGTRRLPLHKLLEDLTWIGSPYSSDAPLLRKALHRNLLGTDYVVEILEFLISQNPELLSSRDRDGSLPLHVACRRGVSFDIVQSLVGIYKASVKSVTSEGDLPLFLACEMPKTTLDTIFLLMKLYPDSVYR
jgi:ankyrin repeat protein